MENNTAFVNDDSVYNRKINPTPKPETEIGIDTKETVVDNIIQAGTASVIDVGQIQAFTQVANTRNEIYNAIDTMSQDPLIASVLESYASDCVEPNDEGRIIWAESSDPEIAKYIQFILDTMNVDKYAYSWAYNLIKYGDLYLRLFHESDFKDELFESKESSVLNEDINIITYGKKDKFVHYVEMHKNPAEIFELTKHSKTYAYIKAPVSAMSINSNNGDPYLNNTLLNQYKFNKNDVDIFDAKQFVHATLVDNSSREAETVDLFIPPENEGGETKNYSYTVKRGQPLFYDTFKIWRQLQLLEASVLLNRITKSSITRVVNVQVGDMPKEQVTITLNNIKRLIEQKAALNDGVGMSEYSNPGPIENTIYIPVRGEQGNISISTLGGDVDVKGLADLDYFKRRLFGSLGVPQQYFGETEDAAGFSGGESLARISARYAKRIKRIQNALIQLITDAINIMLLDKGFNSRVNKFALKMQPPTTIEEIERRDNRRENIGIIGDVMNQLGDIENNIIKLKIVKSLLSNTVTNTEVIDLIDEAITQLENGAEIESETKTSDTEEISDDEPMDFGSELSSFSGDLNMDSGAAPEEETSETEISDTEETNNEETILPTPDELGQDFTNNDEF